MASSSKSDPVSALSKEGFTRIISSLPAQDVQSSSAVSKEWREIITSNPDLSRSLNPQGQIENISTVSSESVRDQKDLINLAGRRVENLDLDLSSLFKHLPQEDKDWQTKALQKFKSSTDPSKQTLQDINLVLKKEDLRKGAVTELLLPLIELLLGFRFPGLQKIRIDAPFNVSLKAGVHSPGHKFVNITANDPGEDQPPYTIVLLINQVRVFTGHGLTVFHLPYYHNPFDRFGEPKWSKEVISNAGVIEELWKSKDTLEDLDLRALSEGGVPIWDLCINCLKLSSIAVSIFYKAPPEPTPRFIHHPMLGPMVLENPVVEKVPETLEIPRELLVRDRAKMKVSNFFIGGYAVEWDPFVQRFIGEDLEELELGSADIPFLKYHAILCGPSQDTLRKISIKWNTSPDHDMFYLAANLTFPNLTELIIAAGDGMFFSLFENFVAPKLKHLEIDYDLPMMDMLGENESAPLFHVLSLF